MCGEKQSLKKVYFQSSSAQDCRQAVQMLNERKGLKDEEDGQEYSETEDISVNESISYHSESKIVKIHGQTSRWQKYNIEQK